MKRKVGLVALLITALAASSLAVGCGGDGGGTPPAATGGTTGGTTGGQAAAPPAPPAPGGSKQVETAVETVTAVPYKPTPTTPKFFADMVALKTPLVVYFFAKTAPSYREVSKEIAQVEKTYGNQAEFVKLSMDDAYDMASLPADKQAKAQEITNLAEQFQVRFVPYIVIIDRNSMITYTHSGYIDAKTLEQELFKALKR